MTTLGLQNSPNKVMIVQATIFFYLTASSLTMDDLPHTAISKVPAIIGQTIQLRCSKIIEKQESDYYRSASCYPQEGEGSCYHAWSKDGNLIDLGTSRFSNMSVITHDYCENFKGTSDMMKKIRPFIKENPDKDDYYKEREMSCYTSLLTITGVEASDFGTYSCNFSNHDEETYWYGRENSIQNITLYNSNDEAEIIPQGIDYFQSAYVEKMSDSILVQCVVSGMNLEWKIDIYDSKFCDGQSKCLVYSGYLEESRKEDYWRCFNFTTARHSPYKNVTESIAYFYNVCPVDNARLYCNKEKGSSAYKDNPDAEPYTDKFSAYISTASPEHWGNYNYYFYDRGERIAVASAIILPILGVFFIAAAIVSAVRVGCCNCCNSQGYSSPVILQYSHQAQVPIQ